MTSFSPSLELIAVANFIKEKKLETVATFSLEMYRPMVGLGSAAMLIADPFLRLLPNKTKIVDLLKDRANVDWLIEELGKPLTAP